MIEGVRVAETTRPAEVASSGKTNHSRPNLR